MNSWTINFDSYGDYYRAEAEEISDAELRERGMSAHEVLRVRSLSDVERCKAITAFLVKDALSELRSRH
ncbi:hypothetical protein [Thioclava electrotropha]|uniref:DUF3606 domain-containing protein n=1 Tax=Thioclava electrotropha TaxID=1549850 RepID=A0ABX6YVE1_9RHOB|nr:hypothetical protein [Thioclava electrotropha]QPZ91198.1 hypothetical protein AKL02_009990 [Thioclava electrotropha]